jgi:hypothetical protein
LESLLRHIENCESDEVLVMANDLSFYGGGVSTIVTSGSSAISGWYVSTSPPQWNASYITSLIFSNCSVCYKSNPEIECGDQSICNICFALRWSIAKQKELGLSHTETSDLYVKVAKALNMKPGVIK